MEEILIMRHNYLKQNRGLEIGDSVFARQSKGTITKIEGDKVYIDWEDKFVDVGEIQGVYKTVTIHNSKS